MRLVIIAGYWHGWVCGCLQVPTIVIFGISFMEKQQRRFCQSRREIFFDDLTLLEIVDLLTIGISSSKTRHPIPNDIREDNLYNYTLPKRT